MSQTRCCGQLVTTPYCPLCGTPIRRFGPLDDLLVYLKKSEKMARTVLQGSKEELAKAADPGSQQRYQRAVEKGNRIADKWATWISELENLMTQNNDKGST